MPEPMVAEVAGRKYASCHLILVGQVVEVGPVNAAGMREGWEEVAAPAAPDASGWTACRGP
jgi:hypothetical protein